MFNKIIFIISLICFFLLIGIVDGADFGYNDRDISGRFGILDEDNLWTGDNYFLGNTTLIEASILKVNNSLNITDVTGATKIFLNGNGESVFSNDLKCNGVTTLNGVIMTAGTDIKPTADSTTALNIAQADGTNFVTFDTTNKITYLTTSDILPTTTNTGNIGSASKRFATIYGTSVTGVTELVSPSLRSYSFGGALTLLSRAPNSDVAPGIVSITGGNSWASASTNINGGNVRIRGGTPVGAGLYGNVILNDLGGKVGIGTATPSSALEVNGNVNITGNLITNNITLSKNNSKIKPLIDTATAFSIAYANGSNLVTFDTLNGKVGIGKQPIGTAQLDVQGNIFSRSNIYTGGIIGDLYFEGTYIDFLEDYIGFYAGSSGDPDIPVTTMTYSNSEVNVNPTFQDIDFNVYGILKTLFKVDVGKGVTELNSNTTTISGLINGTGNTTINNYYGGMFFRNNSGMSFNLNDTFQVFNLFLNSSYKNGFNWLDNSTLQLIEDGGLYQVIWQTSGTGVNNHIYEGYIYVNGVQQANTYGRAVGQQSNAISMHGFGFIPVQKYDNVTLRLADVGATTFGTAYEGNLNLFRVANYDFGTPK